MGQAKGETMHILSADALRQLHEGLATIAGGDPHDDAEHHIKLMGERAAVLRKLLPDYDGDVQAVRLYPKWSGGTEWRLDAEVGDSVQTVGHLIFSPPFADEGDMGRIMAQLLSLPRAQVIGCDKPGKLLRAIPPAG
jgi:hypothetical protein